MERYAYDEMRKQLPHDWVVLANVSWARREVDSENSNRGYLREGQADFVVLIPGQGLLVVEIKASVGYRVAEGGQWWRLKRAGLNGETYEELMSEPPPDQATRNMYSLVEHCKRLLGWSNFPGLYGWVVWFPQCEVARGTHHLNDPATVLVAKDNAGLTQRFRATLAARGPADRGKQFNPTNISEVSRTLLSEGFRLEKADTAVELGNDLGKIKALTTNQFSALQGIFWNDRVAVTGPAGSGKTLLGIWRARAAKGESRRTLFACYNRKLADYLRVQYPDLKDEIVHIDKFFRDHISRHIPFPQPPQNPADQSPFWREAVPGMVFDYLPSSEESYDTVIVDEGQDFSLDQQLAILEFVRPDGGQYAFFWDAGQDLYSQKLSLPEGTSAFFVLEHNCRNTKKICDAATKIGQRHVLSMPGMPDGMPPIVEHVGSAQGMANRCWTIVNEWRKATDGRIAVLSPYTLAKSSLASHVAAHGLRLVEDPSEWDTAGAVLFSTIKSFKGIEADGVVVIDLDEPGGHPAIKVEDLYVACTRPVARLALLASKQSAASYFRTGIDSQT